MFFLLMIFPGGCAQPDRWPVFQPDFHEAVPENPWPPPDTAEKYRPGLDRPTAAGLLPEYGPLDLSVEEAVLLALQYNRDLAVEQLTDRKSTRLNSSHYS